jgi:hypothetical protein
MTSHTISLNQKNPFIVFKFSTIGPRKIHDMQEAFVEVVQLENGYRRTKTIIEWDLVPHESLHCGEDRRTTGKWKE